MEPGQVSLISLYYTIQKCIIDVRNTKGFNGKILMQTSVALKVIKTWQTHFVPYGL